MPVKTILIFLAIACFVWAFVNRGTNGLRPECLGFALLTLAWMS
jgi:hypothetical protein